MPAQERSLKNPILRSTVTPAGAQESRDRAGGAADREKQVTGEPLLKAVRGTVNHGNSPWLCGHKGQCQKAALLID